MRNTADVTGGKTIAVLLQSISGVSAINLSVAFYDIHERNGEVLYVYSVPDTTRDLPYIPYYYYHYYYLQTFLSLLLFDFYRGKREVLFFYFVPVNIL
jgi:hypothetical protein